VCVCVCVVVVVAILYSMNYMTSTADDSDGEEQDQPIVKLRDKLQSLTDTHDTVGMLAVILFDHSSWKCPGFHYIFITNDKVASKLSV